MSWANEDHRLWSLYRFLMIIHRSKRDYYRKGTSRLSDNEYDAMERSFLTLHGKKRLDLYLGVGYTEGNFEKFRDKYEQINIRSKA